jgi:hypothetical protein
MTKAEHNPLPPEVKAIFDEPERIEPKTLTSDWFERAEYNTPEDELTRWLKSIESPSEGEK